MPAIKVGHVPLDELSVTTRVRAAGPYRPLRGTFSKRLWS
jgi:hypothetical protein